MKNITKANIYFIIIMLLEVIAPIILSPIYKALNISNIGIMLVLNHVCIFLVPAAIYFIITKKSVKQTLRLNKIRIKDALFMILIGIMSYPISIFFSLIATLVVPNNLAEVVSNLMSLPFIIMLVIMAVTPAITEEVTIRGIILSGYKGMSRYKSALITGLIFGMMHLDAHQFMYATALGFVLAMVVSVTNSIFAGCIVHFTMNATSLVIQKVLFSVMDMSAVTSTQNSAITDLGILPIIFSIVLYGTMAIGFGVLIWLIIRNIERANIGRGVIEYQDNKSWIKSGDKVFNLSFAFMIIVYIGIMLFQNVYFS